MKWANVVVNNNKGIVNVYYDVVIVFYGIPKILKISILILGSENNNLYYNRGANDSIFSILTVYKI